MTTPGSAPSTPASNDPSWLASLPSSNSAVSSPRYHTFPSASWAYQSSVSSTSWPSSVTVSRTTAASTPFASVLVSLETVTTTSWTLPLVSVSRNRHCVPGSRGKYGWSEPAAKSAGSSSTGSSPWGSSVPVWPPVLVASLPLLLVLSVLLPSSPHAASGISRTSAAALVRRMVPPRVVMILEAWAHTPEPALNRY